MEINARFISSTPQTAPHGAGVAAQKSGEPAGAAPAQAPADGLSTTASTTDAAPGRLAALRHSLARAGERVRDLAKAGVEVLRHGGGFRGALGETVSLVSAFQLSGLGFLVPSFLKAQEAQIPSPPPAATAASSPSTARDVAGISRPYESVSPDKARAITGAGWQGQPLWCGAGTLEDNHLMAYEVTRKDGSTALVLKGTVSEALNDAVELALVRAGGVSTTGGAPGLQYELKGGALRESREKKPLKGKSITARPGGGLRLTYRPREAAGDRQSTPLAVQGELTVELTGYGRSASDVERALAGVEKVLGRSMAPATKGEMELLSLDKTIRARKAEEGAYEKGLAALDRRQAPIEERLAFAESHLRRAAGAGVDIASTWAPLQDAAGGSTAGAPYWIRSDAGPYLDGALKGTVLTHNMYPKDEAKGILTLFRNTGHLLCTRERNHRLGLPERGLASERDMDVGAGNYSFLHIGRSAESGTLVLSNTLLARADTLVHRFGLFGRTGKEDLGKRLTLDDIGHHPVYEVMVKNNIPLAQYVERINVSTDEVRDNVIAGLKALGYGQLHGVPVEDIVRVKPSFLTQLSAAMKPFPHRTAVTKGPAAQPLEKAPAPAAGKLAAPPVRDAASTAPPEARPPLALPTVREPVRMAPPRAITEVEGAADTAPVLTRTRLNPSMLPVAGSVLVKLADGGELTIPQASTAARSVLRNFRMGALDDNCVTELVIVRDLAEAEALAASPSGGVVRRTGGNAIVDTDLEKPFRRIYVTRDAVGRNFDGTAVDPSPFRDGTPGARISVSRLAPRTLGPLIGKDDAFFCGGLVSISAEPPEGFFVSSTAMELREKGHPLAAAADAPVWLYRVPDTRKDSYFKFLYANPDRPKDTPREGKFLIATGVGPASDPTSPGGSEARLLWMGDEQHGALDGYLKTLAKPDLTLDDLRRHEGFVQKLPGGEVLLGKADHTHTLTKEGFGALKTDPTLYRRVYSEEYDSFLRTLFEKPEGPPAAASYLLATSRGCSQQCTICCSGGCSTPQFFDGPRMMAEIEKIAAEAKPKDSEIVEVFFLDSNLNNDPQRIIEFADLYEKSPLNGRFRFYCRHSSPNGFLKTGDDGVKHPNRELIAAYGKLGLKEVFMGIDTYDDNSTLTMKSNRFQVAQKEGAARPTYRAGEIRELVKALDDGGLVSKGFFVTNNPWVTDLDRIDSYYNVLQLWLESPHFSIDSRSREVLQLKPFEGSPITDAAGAMKLDVVEKGRFVARGVLGEMDEMMSFTALGAPRAESDAGEALREFREGIDRIRAGAESVLADSARTPGDRRKAELIIGKLVSRDGDLAAQLAAEQKAGTAHAAELADRARAFAQKHRALPPFDPAQQKTLFLDAAQTLFEGLRKTLPLRMELPASAPGIGKTPADPLAVETNGYRAGVAHLRADEPHTLENLGQYLADNLGEATLSAIRTGAERFVIVQGEGKSAYAALEKKGWKLGGFVQKSQGFHQICEATTDKGEKVYLVARVNGEDRVAHLQSLLKLAGLPADRLATTGAFTSLKDEYAKTFKGLGKPPDFVVYGLARTAATAVLAAHPLRNAPELLEAAGGSAGKRAPVGNAAPHDLEGLSMHVIELEDGRTMWFLPPLYGDLSRDVMEALVDAGAKSIVFAGTTGALNPALHVGQIVSPTVRIMADGTRENLDWLAPSPKGSPCSYTRVSTPNIETQAWLEESQRAGVDTIEVELGYWLDALKSRPDVRLHVQNVVSDVLGGEEKSDMTRWSKWDNFKAQRSLRESLQASFALSGDDLRVSEYRAVPLLTEAPAPLKTA